MIQKQWFRLCLHSVTWCVLGRSDRRWSQKLSVGHRQYKTWNHPEVSEGVISYREVEHFHMGVYGDWLTLTCSARRSTSRSIQSGLKSHRPTVVWDLPRRSKGVNASVSSVLVTTAAKVKLHWKLFVLCLIKGKTAATAPSNTGSSELL